MPTTEVVNLGSVFGGDELTRRFAERYFRVQHTDLLFANAAIFVEGVAERMLVPLFMERDFKELNTRYVSFLDIGGSHAHRLQPLVEKLRIPTVIITDADPMEVKKSDIVKREGAPSGMPEVYGPLLTKSQLRDVIEYMASLKEPPTGLDENKPRALRGLPPPRRSTE